MIEKILKFLEKNGPSRTSDIVYFTWKNRTTVYRILKKLIESGDVIQIKKWIYEAKKKIEDYFDIPIRERKKKKYNPDFLRNYIPNKTFFFSQEDIIRLDKSIKHISIDTDFYKTNRRLLETLLIDLSFASSYLEWNTYSYLDTEVLLKYNEINNAKTSEETQMILNHKRAIEYMIFYKKDLKFEKKTFYEIHQLLWEKLLSEKELWIIRNGSVEIGWSTYKPLENKVQLEGEFDVFLKKLREIKNPFEQSLFIMCFIPYLQLFSDVNKRVSRIIWNLPLIKHDLPVLSLMQVEKKKYIVSILAMYELNDTNLMKSIRLDNYLLNLERYKNLLN